MARFATIDVGSNSLLVHIVERGADGSFTVLADRSEITRLGEGLAQTGAFGVEPMRRSVEALRSFAELARELEVEQLAAVGTMALRNATNAADFLALAKAETGIEIEVIPGEEEARLAYRAAMSGLPMQLDEVVVFDVGGGSTEFVFGNRTRIEKKFSLNIGALRLTDSYCSADPVPPEALDRLMRALCAEFDSLTKVDARTILGIGGATTNIAAVELGLEQYDPQRVHGSRLSLDRLQALLERFAFTPLEERRRIPGLQPKRAETIVAGTAIIISVLKRLEADALIVSDRGLRHGLMADRFSL
ncbi:MAG: Ppx/GppA phosphatase family protein [Myxococcota bacterium]|jgi:exopolyphosphatase/guanosine-5'-triphosphate,3'-diphosphate pyrophosphatase|nr:Ppx/GppA phosphatase family protein [Myxococcota bacterium]